MSGCGRGGNFTTGTTQFGPPLTPTKTVLNRCLRESVLEPLPSKPRILPNHGHSSIVQMVFCQEDGLCKSPGQAEGDLLPQGQGP